MNGTQAFLKNLIDKLNASQLDRDAGQIFFFVHIDFANRVKSCLSIFIFHYRSGNCTAIPISRSMSQTG